MMAKLLTYLKFEEQLLDEMIKNSESQQKALVKYDITALDSIVNYQQELARQMREAEEQRIRLMMTLMGISRADATKLKLSSLEESFMPEEISEFRELKKNLSGKINALQMINSTNRLLSNRARNNINNIITVFTKGSNHVCNVRV